MTRKNFVSRVLLAAVFFGTPAPRLALGGSAAIGTIAGSLNATVGGEAIQPNTVVFSGDRLHVTDGAAVLAINWGSRLAFGQRTAASFFKGSNELVVLLEQGSLSLYHPGSAEALRVRLGALSLVPVKGFSTLGDVAMLDGRAVVTAKEGVLRLERNGSAAEVRKGQTISVPTKIARAPQGAPSAAAGPPPQHRGGSSLVQWVGVGAGVTGAILGAKGISNGNNASDTANQAITASSAAAATAADAATAAQAAATAAAAATSAAIDAGAAAQAAGSAAVAAALIGEAAANVVGCDLNRFANSEGKPSPYTPFTGFTCP